MRRHKWLIKTDKSCDDFMQISLKLYKILLKYYFFDFIVWLLSSYKAEMSMHNQANFCLSLFYAIHLAKNTINKIKQPPPNAKNAIPKKRSLFPTKLDLLKLIHFSPHVGSISIL
jgi:hypothetical protein